MNVNEKIVECWLNNCKKFFTITNLEYDNYHSAIDVLGLDFINKKILDIEVKFKAGIKINDTDRKQNGYRHIKKQLFSDLRTEVIRSILGDMNGFNMSKVFVTTKRFLTIENYDYWVERFASDNIELFFFEDIINELSEEARRLTKADDEILQTLRILNQFGIE